MRPLSVKLGSLFCVAVMVIVVFQQVQRAGAPADVAGGAGNGAIGEDWESSRPVAFGEGDSLAPSAAAAGDGVLHLAWIDSRTGSNAVYYKRSDDGGDSFTGDRRLSDAGVRPGRPSVAASSDGVHVVVSWDSIVNVNNHTGRAVVFRHSADGGVKWERTTFVEFGSQPRVAFQGDDMILAFLQDDWVNGATYLRVLRLSYSTVTQGPVGDLLSFVTSGSAFSIIVSGVSLHVLWNELIQGRMTILHSSVDLSSGRVDGAHLVSLVTGTLTPDSIAFASFRGRIVAAWSETRSGVARVFAAKSADGGVSWTSSVALTDGKSNARHPELAANATGRLFFVWQDDGLGPWQLYGSVLMDLGIPVRTAVRLSYSKSDAVLPAAAVDSAGHAYLFWQDRRNARSEVYMDGDLALHRPLIGSILVYAGRLPLSSFATPQETSRASFLQLLRDMYPLIAMSEEQAAAMKIRNDIIPRMDGSLGGSGSDDLLVEPEAQRHLAWSFHLMLRELDPPSQSDGTRSGGGWGITADEPLPPDTGFQYSAYAPVFNITVSDITSTTARVDWETDPPNAYATWLNWGPNVTMGNQILAYGPPYNVTISGLTANTTYYYGVQAVLFTTPPPPMWQCYDSFYTGVVIKDMDYYATSASNVTVWWETNLPSTSLVRYNTTEDYGLTATGANGTFHEVNLTGLDPRNTYHVQMESAAISDSALWIRSGDMNFTSHLFIKNFTQAKAAFAGGSYYVKMSWNTTRNATSEVRFGNTTLYGSQVNGTSGKTHNVTLWNLKSATTYFFQARSVGLANANDTDAVAGVPFGTPPISVYNITVNATTSSATISWESNYNGTSVVRCGSTSNYTNNVTGSSGTLHSIAISNLLSNTTYHFRVESTALANANDTATGLDRTFTTKGILVSNVQIPSIGQTTATITWNTNIAGTSVVRYGKNSIWEYTATGANGTSHSVNLAGLLPDTVYKCRAESSTVTNLNDTNVSLMNIFLTAYAPNDAGSGQDAGNSIPFALPIEPGAYTGRIQGLAPPPPPPPPADPYDFYRFIAFGNQTIRAQLVPPPYMDLDLYLYGPNSQMMASSQMRGFGLKETIVFTATTPGLWYLEVRYFATNGPLFGYYGLTFNVTGGGPDRLVRDVGAQAGSQGDAILLGNLPGLSIDSTTGWGQPARWNGQSRGTFWNMNNNPWYRNASANAVFYLNLYRNSHEKYTDYLLTFQYYASADSNLSVYNGAGWVNVTTLPGKANWWTWSFVLDHTMFYDKLPSTFGINVAMRFSSPVKVDNISAVAYGYSTYVGHGSDDSDALFHSPGILTGPGWADTGNGYKNGLNHSELILNIPDTGATYNVDFRFKGDVTSLSVEQYTGTAWVEIARLVSFSTDNHFNTNQSAYYDAYPFVPGMNVLVRFVAYAVNEFSYASMHIVRWFDEVGVTGDNFLWLHDPGMSLYPNGQWDPITILDGRLVRQAQPGAEVYLSAPLIDSGYVVYLTYKAMATGHVEQWHDGAYEILGDTLGDSQWHTGTYRTNASFYRDYYGSAQLNVMLHFTVQLFVDRMWAEPDQDGDHQTEYGETQSYPSQTLPNGTPPISFNFPAYTSGTYRFEGRSRGDFDQSNSGYQFSEQDFYVNNTLVQVVIGAFEQNHKIGHLEEDVWINKTSVPPGWQRDFSFDVSFCSGPKTMKVERTGLPSEIAYWQYTRIESWTKSNDTDGDGLSDYDEACVYHTAVNDPDTDRDGLTDYDELYSFQYRNNSAPGYLANVTMNITVNAFARYSFSIRTTALAQGGSVSAQVYVDGQQKVTKNTSNGWSNQSFNFVSSMAKGMHSLQIQRGSGLGKVWVFEAEVDRVEITSPLYPDTDKDGLSDGGEVKGLTGFYTSPTIADTDGDKVPDGNETKVLRTDPTKKDTDGDGFNDGVDLDPLHDLIVQVTVKQLYGVDDCPEQYTCTAWSEVGVNGKYTIGSEAPINSLRERPAHYLAVNVPDDRKWAMVVISAFRNDPNGQVQIDLTRDASRSVIVNFTVGDNKLWGYSYGTDTPPAPTATLYYEIRTVKFGKVNTVLMTPTDWSTVQNGSTGAHRFVGEQRFAVININTMDAGGAEAYWNMEQKETIGTTVYYKDLTGHGHRAGWGTLPQVQGYWGYGVHLEDGNNWLETSDNPKLHFKDEMTISFWVMPHVDYHTGDSAKWYWAVGKKDAWRIGWLGSTNGLRFEIKNGSQDYIVDSPTVVPLDQGSWYHITAEYDGMNMTIYLGNSVLVSQMKGAFWIGENSEPVQIGRDWDGSCFDGVVDEVALYGRALSNGEVGIVNTKIVDLDMDTRLKNNDVDAAGILGYEDLSGHGNYARAEGASVVTDVRPVEGQRGLAVQVLNDARLMVSEGAGVGVTKLTLSVRLQWLGGNVIQTVAYAEGLQNGLWVGLYSMSVAGPAGTVRYALRRESGALTTIYPPNVKLPPNEWHVATLTYDGQYSIFYIDGEKMHTYDWGSPASLATFDSTRLCIARCASDALFNGFFDDLTLWNRSLSQGEIRALNYLDRGLNGIVVPRGLFMQSEFFASMNSSDGSAFHPGNPLLGSTIMGNDNPRELNARVVQQLVAANLTLAEAWTWILKLQRNSTGMDTSFPLVVTDEIYTIGFDQALMNVLPNMTVENSGNHSVPPPPIRKPSYWELLWNSFTGLVSAVWNAVVAVCTFIANVVAAVVKWGIGLAMAIAEGKGLEYIYDTVVKPFVDAILAFVKWIIDFVMAVLTAAVRFLLESITNILKEALSSISGGLIRMYESFENNADFLVAAIAVSAAIFSLAVALAALPLIVRAAEIVFKAVTLGFAWLVSKIATQTFLDFVIQFLAGITLACSLSMITVEILTTVSWMTNATLGLLSGLGIASSMMARAGSMIAYSLGGLSSSMSTANEFMKRWIGFGISVVALLLLMQSALMPQKGPAKMCVDFATLAVSIFGLFYYVKWSQSDAMETMDWLSDIAKMLEKIITFSSPFVILALIGVRWATGGYNG